MYTHLRCSPTSNNKCPVVLETIVDLNENLLIDEQSEDTAYECKKKYKLSSNQHEQLIAMFERRYEEICEVNSAMEDFNNPCGLW